MQVVSSVPAANVFRMTRATLLLLGLLIGFTACTTTRNTLFLEIDSSAQRGDFDGAINLLEENERTLYTDRDGVLLHLDRGMLLHFAGRHRESVLELQEAERLIEEYFTLQLRQAATSLLLNDTAMNYAGEDFEDIYLNVFSALSYLAMDDPQAAFVEIRRIDNKLNLLETKYRSLAAGFAAADQFDAPPPDPGDTRFYNSALARYLSLVIYRSEGNRDSARISFEQMENAFAEQRSLYPHSNPISSKSIEPVDGVPLSVIAFSGRSPIKRASTLRIRTERNRVHVIVSQEDDIGLIPSTYLSFEFPVEAGYNFRFELPRMEMRGSEVTRIRVLANGQELGEVGLLEDIQRIAYETFQVSRPIVFVRSVVRATLKGIAGQRAGRAMEEAGVASGSAIGWLAGAIGSIATDIALDQSEQADLRISRFFPAFAHAGEWVLDPGTYRIEVEYLGPRGLLWRDDLGEVNIRPGSPNLVSSFFNG
ncbi:MAG: hypothetical protein EA383_06640 [Spirochaetaceae bacterium]|nr:MAG: hypothetical protein EA383_06640 [Spirochaetaceae bacterium]